VSNVVNANALRSLEFPVTETPVGELADLHSSSNVDDHPSWKTRRVLSCFRVSGASSATETLGLWIPRRLLEESGGSPQANRLAVCTGYCAMSGIDPVTSGTPLTSGTGPDATIRPWVLQEDGCSVATCVRRSLSWKLVRRSSRVVSLLRRQVANVCSPANRMFANPVGSQTPSNRGNSLPCATHPTGCLRILRIHKLQVTDATRFLRVVSVTDSCPSKIGRSGDTNCCRVAILDALGIVVGLDISKI